MTGPTEKERAEAANVALVLYRLDEISDRLEATNLLLLVACALLTMIAAAILGFVG